MEQQLGGRGPLSQRGSSSTPTNDKGSAPYQYEDGRSGGDEKSTDGQGDFDRLQETIAHQKKEIVRLLNAVKTLSSENTKLVKVCGVSVPVFPWKAR